MQVSDTDLLAADDDRPTPGRLTVYGRGDVELLQRMSSRCSASMAENGWPQVRSELAERARTAVSQSGDSAATDSTDTTATRQPDVEAADDDDPFGIDDRAAWSDPAVTEQRRTPRRRIGRSSGRGRNDAYSAPSDRSQLEDEDPFA